MALKKYIVGLLVFAVVLVGVYFLALHQMTKGYVDKYYPKFTQEAGGLIVGLSRAQYGLVPSVIEDNFPESTKPVINFAFELYQSPYGEILLEDLKNKMKPDVKNGFFLLEVSPASFLIPKGVSEQEVYELDSETILGKMEQVKTNPNYEYLKECYGGSLYKGFFRMKPFGNITVHDDGWVAFANAYGNYTVTDSMVDEWKQQSLQTYQSIVPKQKRSTSRIQSFIKTIAFLKQHGKVCVVRMPASKEIITFEDSKWPHFSTDIEKITAAHQVHFFDYSQQKSTYQFYDGSHLFDTSAVKFTKELCQEIKRVRP